MTRSQALQLAFLLRFYRRWGNFAAIEVAKHYGNLERVGWVISQAMMNAAGWQTWKPDATMEIDDIALHLARRAGYTKQNGRWEREW
jgi:hypothetical protein